VYDSKKEARMESSKMEMRIHDILTMNDVPFAEEYTFPDLVTKGGVPLRFDFAVFDDLGDIDFLIEANGRQHYAPVPKYGGMAGFRKQQYNDARKKQYCRSKNITLVTIPYQDESKISYEYILKAAGYGED
jgi:hypothetical protein